MCNHEFRERHIDNDDLQDQKISSLEKRYIWFLVVSFIGSLTGGTMSTYLRGGSILAKISELWPG